MSRQIVGDRANQAVVALAGFLTGNLGFEFSEQWAQSSSPARGSLPLGAVICTGGEEFRSGLEVDSAEPSTGEEFLRLGHEELRIQVDFWAPTHDDRSDIKAQLDALWEGQVGDDLDDSGDISLTANGPGDPIIRYIKGGWRFLDSPETVELDEWRYILDVVAEADMIVANRQPPIGISVNVRLEDVVPPPPENTFGQTVWEQRFPVDDQ